MQSEYSHCVWSECPIFMLDREGLKDKWRRFLKPFTFGPMWQLQPLSFTLGLWWLQQLNLTNQVVWMTLIMTPERLNTWDLPPLIVLLKYLHPSPVALDSALGWLDTVCVLHTFWKLTIMTAVVTMSHLLLPNVYVHVFVIIMLEGRGLLQQNVVIAYYAT